MKKESIFLVLCLMFGLLAGCGSTESAVASETAAASAESVAEAPAEEAPAEEVSAEEAPAEEAPAEEVSAEEAPAEEAVPEVDLTITMPLTEEEISFTMWHDFVPPLAEYMPNGMTDNLSYATMEEISGVHMEITSVTKDSAATNLSLLVASGDYPDIWDGFAGYYGQGIDTAIDMEIV